MNIISLRVSKEDESLQDIEAQKDAIIEKFNLDEKDCLILRERISAYDIDKIKKRKEFLRLINILFDADKTTVRDLYLRHLKTKEEINLYIWDYHRIMRNLEYSILFAILTDLFQINVYSYKDGKIRIDGPKTPSEKFVQYIKYGASAFSSEEYSYTISTNVKKAVKKKDGITTSRQGNKWGRRFKGLDGKTIELSQEKILALNRRILALKRYYNKRKVSPYYQLIIGKINEEFKISISKSYISRRLNIKKTAPLYKESNPDQNSL